jgi:hypothetical protein
VVPIRCDSQTIVNAKELLPCDFVDFPCKYMGLHLSIKKLIRSQIRSVIDRVASSLPGWMAELMNKAGHAVHVQFVMTAKIIYTTIALDLPMWAIKAIKKILKGFLWKGRKEANGGHCLLAWPKELGGLDLFDIRRLSLALRARWPWLHMTEPDKPWAQFQIHVCKEVQSLIDMAVVTKVGDISNTLFWKDKWLDGKRIKDIAPAVYAMVPNRIINKRKVNEAMLTMRWIADFQGALTFSVLIEYFELFQ